MYITIRKSTFKVFSCWDLFVCKFVLLADLNRRESKAERGLRKESGLYEDWETEQKVIT